MDIIQEMTEGLSKNLRNAAMNILGKEGKQRITTEILGKSDIRRKLKAHRFASDKDDMNYKNVNNSVKKKSKQHAKPGSMNNARTLLSETYIEKVESFPNS